MKRILFLLGLLLPVASIAQTTTDVGAGMQGRISVGADYKIVKGLHLNLEEEVRFNQSLQRLQTTVGVDYKVNKYFKTGISYGWIEKYKSVKKEFRPYHRGRLYVQTGVSFGDFHLSLRETLQLTHKSGTMNTTQAPRNALALKSRIKLDYKGWKPVEPYVFFELRTALNDAKVNATYNTATGTWSDYSFGGYGIVHNNRYRTGLGVDWTLAKHHKLGLYGLLDRNLDRVIDTDKDRVLQSFTIEKSFTGVLGLSYTFRF